MKNRTIRNLAIVLMVPVALAAGCSRTGDKNAPAAAGGGPGGAGRPGQADRVPRVDTATAEIKPLKLVKQYIGEIKPYYSIDVRSTASGWLTSVNVDIGDRVNRNAVLCTIENEDVRAQISQAEANVSIVKASVARAEAELEKVSLETVRVDSLFEKGYVSKREQEQARSAEKQARASLDAAKGQLDQALAQLKNIQVKLRDTTVRAPFSGIVAERYLDPGAYVSPANSVLRLVDDSKVKAVVNVVEEDFPGFREGAAAEITADSYPGETFSGKIVRIAPSIDNVSRTAVVEILLANPEGKLRGGMTARAGMVMADNAAALVIPENALRRDVETGLVFALLVADGKAVRREVRPGIKTPGAVEIIEGLNPGDVVITGDTRVSDGMKVEVAGGGQGGKGGFKR